MFKFFEPLSIKVSRQWSGQGQARDGIIGITFEILQASWEREWDAQYERKDPEDTEDTGRHIIFRWKCQVRL